jgi:hypothetical protein
MQWMISLLCLTMIVTLGCSEPGSTLPTGTFACTNSVTGLCEPCTGVQLCIDPLTCAVVPCNTGDVLFGGGDSKTGDASTADANTADGTVGDGTASDAQATDTGATDTGATDTANVDTGDSVDTKADVAGEDAAKGDSAADGDAGPPGCIAGTTGCLDLKTPALCVDSAWQAVASCPAGHVCKSKGCSCANECEAIGQKTCTESKVAAIKSCVLDDGGCLHWAIPIACEPDELCQSGLCIKKSACDPVCPIGQLCDNAVCKPDPNACAPACTTGQVCQNSQCVGTLTCGQMMACVEQFSQGPDDTLTKAACLAKGTPTAQAQYQTRKACIALACQTLIDAGKIYEALLCVYSKCATEQTTCTGVGSGDCGALGGCLSGCGTSSVCTDACHAQASVTAVQKWYSLLVCGDQFCAGQAGDAFAQCTAQKCNPAYQGCFGGGGQGGLSCSQVLACAGKCGNSKDCAQQCKAQASPAGLSTLEALLACNNKYCAQLCQTSSAAQCDNCLSVYCGQQSGACN